MAGPRNHDRSIPSHCEIRDVALTNPFYRYCANHPYRRPDRDPIPIGPILRPGQITPETAEIAPPLLDPNMGTHRVAWKASPDTEEVRKHLLELLAELGEQPAQKEYFPPLSTYFPTSSVATTVVWQLGEFRETRAVPGLMRMITRYDGPIVEYARKALAKIRRMPGGHADGAKTKQPNEARQLVLDVLDWLRETSRKALAKIRGTPEVPPPIVGNEQPNDARQLVLDVLDWLRETYCSHRFFTERDVVWTVQKRLISEASGRSPRCRVFHEYKMTNGQVKSPPADLVLLGPEDQAELAIEFKYEPAHQRANTEFPPTKFPVVDWKGVVRDTERVHQFVQQGFTPNACSLFIDEGGYFRKRQAPLGSRWEDWNVDGCTHRVSVLISEAQRLVRPRFGANRAPPPDGRQSVQWFARR